jgi:hypothetical protein
LFFDQQNPTEKRHRNVLRQVMQQGIAEGGLLVDGEERQRRYGEERLNKN